MLWFPIVDLIKLFRRENLPLRGDRDSVKEQAKVGMPGVWVKKF